MFHFSEPQSIVAHGVANVPLDLTIGGVPTNEISDVMQSYVPWHAQRQMRRSNLKALLLAPEARTENLVPERRHFKRRPPPSFA